MYNGFRYFFSKQEEASMMTPVCDCWKATRIRIFIVLIHYCYYGVIIFSHTLCFETMEENGETIESDDIVIIVENEAESKPIQEAKPKEEGSLGLLDICPLCKLSFHSREPKLLPCLHSFCKRCLPAPSRSLAYTEQGTNHQMPAEGQGKPCMITLDHHHHYHYFCAQPRFRVSLHSTLSCWIYVYLFMSMNWIRFVRARKPWPLEQGFTLWFWHNYMLNYPKWGTIKHGFE